jgi:uncharacterized repeat protein (TIGR02543 family)
MMTSGFPKRKSWLAAFIILVGLMPLAAQGAYDIHKEIPLRFNYRGANTGGDEKSSGWIWLGGVVESNIYFSKMNVPVALSIPGKMVIQCSKNDIYTFPNVGNQAPCRAWIESRDDPDVPELSSNYGYTLGVKFRDIFTGTELADVGKDFAIKITGNGPMPMGDNRICGIDYLDFASFPISQFIPDTKVIQKVAKKIVGSAGIGKVRLAGELVIEGNYVQLIMADASIRFQGFRNAATYPDPADDPNVETFALTVPSAATLQNSPLYNAESKTLFYEPIIQYSLNLYNTAGLEFSLIGPLHFNFMPTVITKGTNVMSYSCPDATTLHDGSFYNKAADDFKISTQGPVILSFPLTDTPNLPDIAITEVRFNNIPDGEVFADEWTAIDFTITNIGERDTVTSPEPLFTYSLFFNGQPAPDSLDTTLGYPMLFRWIDDVPQDLYKTTLVSLPKNASHRVGAFVYKFQEGPLNLEISTGYNEYKTTQNGQAVYGIGDYNVDNNYKIARQFYVQPKRGTVLGRIVKTPCQFDCYVNGIQVCLKDAAAGGYYECQTTRNISGNDGAYRFEAVPTGDYILEYRPTPLTADQIVAGTLPYWAPRSFSFHHDGADTDDFNYNTTRSGMAIFQYQTLKGYVYDQNNQPIQGATVQLGVADVGPFGPAVATDADGLFIFNRGLPTYDGNGELISSPIPPSGDYSLTFHHDLYQPKEIQFHMSVSESTQKETSVSSYWDPVTLTLDTTAPTIEVHPLASEGYAGNSLNLQFLASDTNGKAIKQYRYTVCDEASGACTGTPSVWIPYPAPDAANPDALVAATVDIGAPLADGPHRLYLEVSDGANVTGAHVPFVKDTVAPVISLLKLKDPLSQSEEATNSKFIEATITISNTETGRLAAYLSNDNAKWSDPFPFTCMESPCTTTIKPWQVLFKDATSSPETKTVYAKVIDEAENASTIVSDTITVDTTGAVVLAGGAEYFNNHLNVPLAIHITPPASVEKYEEGYGSFMSSMTLGDTTSSQYRAQPLITDPAQSITFNHIQLWMDHVPIIGTPGPLNVKIVSQLSSDDPSGNSTTLAEWSATASEVDYSWQRYGYCSIILSSSVTVNTDGTKFLLIYSENFDSENYYRLNGGYYMPPSPNKRQDFIPGTGWVEQADSTLPFRFFETSTGEIRIAADGVCDTETWQSYAVNAVQHINFPSGDGVRSVCVGYWHPSFGDRSSTERKYYDSVVIDTAKPTGSVNFRSVEKDAKTLYLDLNSPDSDVKFYTWRAGGVWTIPEPFSTTLRIPNLPVDTVEVKFIDKAGNESDIYTVTLPQDIFAPYLDSFQINDGSGFTMNPELTFYISATDNRNLAGILFTETVTGTKGEFAATGTSYSPDPPLTVTLPKTKVNDVEVWLDGVYHYSVQAQDAAGNRSTARQAAITLDRQAPTIRNFHLKGRDGRAMTTVPAFTMVLDARDAFGPLQMRYGFNNTTWTVWQSIEPGGITRDIDAPTSMPAIYTLYIEVKDGAGNTTSAQAGIRTNQPPAAPVDGSPRGTAFTDSPRIEPAPFDDADGDALEALWLIVRKADDQTIIVNTFPLYGSTGYTLSLADLSYNVGYTWSARYLDSFGQWSSWSNPVAFVLKRPTLTVNRTGPGRVDSTGTGIECDDTFRDCSEICEPGAQVNLMATPSTGFVFTGWSGDCSGTASCGFVMDGDKTVMASFAPAAAALPGDLDDSRSVDLADAILALRVQAGFHPATLALAADVNRDGKIGAPEGIYILQILSALREASLPNLTVVKSGNGTGTITSTPAGITCGSDCSETYTVATSLELTAMPDAGSTFGGWVGSCSGSGSCMLTVDDVQTIGALFNLERWTLTPSAGDGGTIAPTGVVTVDHGSGQTFTITPSDGYHVADVLVDGVSAGAVTTYAFANVTAAHTIAAVFAPNASMFTITAGVSQNGTIEPHSVVSVAAGGSQTFTITPEAGYHVAQVFVDGVDVGPVTAYTFKSVNANHTIRAEFEADVVFAPEDLAGDWQLAGMTAGTAGTTPYGRIRFDKEARTLGGELTYPDRDRLEVAEGSLPLDKQGVLSGDAWVFNSDVRLTIDSGKIKDSMNFMTFVGRLNSGALEVMTAMKDGTALIPESSADLSGTWRLFGFRAGEGAGPLRGWLPLDRTGKIDGIGSLTLPDKTATWIAGSMSDSLEAPPDILRLNSGQIDGSRSLITFTDAGKATRDFFLAVKDGGTFPRGLLEGTWHVAGIDTRTTWRGRLRMTGEGLVTEGALIDGKGRETAILGGEIAMNEAGVISRSSMILEGDSRLGIDAGKMAACGDMIVWIMETPGETPGLIILTRGRDQR